MNVTDGDGKRSSDTVTDQVFSKKKRMEKGFAHILMESFHRLSDLVGAETFMVVEVGEQRFFSGQNGILELFQKGSLKQCEGDIPITFNVKEDEEIEAKSPTQKSSVTPVPVDVSVSTTSPLKQTHLTRKPSRSPEPEPPGEGGPNTSVSSNVSDPASIPLPKAPLPECRSPLKDVFRKRAAAKDSKGNAGSGPKILRQMPKTQKASIINLSPVKSQLNHETETTGDRTTKEPRNREVVKRRGDRRLSYSRSPEDVRRPTRDDRRSPGGRRGKTVRGKLVSGKRSRTPENQISTRRSLSGEKRRSPIKSLTQEKRGGASKTKSASKQQSVRCDICQITCSGHDPFFAHLEGAKHLAKIQELAKGWEATTEARQVKEYSFKRAAIAIPPPTVLAQSMSASALNDAVALLQQMQKPDDVAPETDVEDDESFETPRSTERPRSTLRQRSSEREGDRRRPDRDAFGRSRSSSMSPEKRSSSRTLEKGRGFKTNRESHLMDLLRNASPDQHSDDELIILE